MKLKAYQVSGETMDGYTSELVFAPNANRARSMAAGFGELSSLEYIDLDAKRAPKADGYSNLVGPEGGVIKFCAHYEQYFELFRNVLGWYEFDKDTCYTCGLTDYDQPQYEVCDGCNQCGDCGCDCCKICNEYACDCEKQEDIAG